MKQIIPDSVINTNRAKCDVKRYTVKTKIVNGFCTLRVILQKVIPLSMEKLI